MDIGQDANSGVGSSTPQSPMPRYSNALQDMNAPYFDSFDPSESMHYYPASAQPDRTHFQNQPASSSHANTPFQSKFNDPIYSSSSTFTPSIAATVQPLSADPSSITPIPGRPFTPPPRFGTGTDFESDTPMQQQQRLSESQIPLPLSPSGRRLKVSMGFRADCEKCRLRVPGHWMHMVE